MKATMLFDKTMTTLERSLDLRAQNQKLITSNIANMDTPNFKAFKMMVGEEMQNADGNQSPLSMTRTQVGHLTSASNGSMGPGRIERVEEDPLSMRGDGNTVELDREMANLAENTLLYNTATRIISSKFKILKDAIKGGQ